MTRKDYILLAQAMFNAKPASTPIGVPAPKLEQWYNDVHAIATKLKAENERFQYERFVNACAEGV